MDTRATTRDRTRTRAVGGSVAAAVAGGALAIVFGLWLFLILIVTTITPTGQPTGAPPARGESWLFIVLLLGLGSIVTGVAARREPLVLGLYQLVAGSSVVVEPYLVWGEERYELGPRSFALGGASAMLLIAGGILGFVAGMTRDESQPG